VTCYPMSVLWWSGCCSPPRRHDHTRSQVTQHDYMGWTRIGDRMRTKFPPITEMLSRLTPPLWGFWVVEGCMTSLKRSQLPLIYERDAKWKVLAYSRPEFLFWKKESRKLVFSKGETKKIGFTIRCKEPSFFLIRISKLGKK
jgi:hypothetical protein